MVPWARWPVVWSARWSPTLSIFLRSLSSKVETIHQKKFSFLLRSFCHLLTLAIAGEIPSFSLLVMLVVVVLSTYPLSMVAVEMVPSIYNNSFLLVMLKYVVGTTHHLIVPLGILAVRTDLR